MNQSQRIHIVWALGLGILGILFAVVGPATLYAIAQPPAPSFGEAEAMLSSLEYYQSLSRGASWFTIGGSILSGCSFLIAFGLWAKWFITATRVTGPQPG